MLIACPKESITDEKRVALTPESALQIQKLGYTCSVESGAGLEAGFSETDSEKAGVLVTKDSKSLWKTANIIIKVMPPSANEIKLLTSDQTLVSFFYPTQNTAQMASLAKSGTNVIAMDMVPRISRAQKMDALSSMAI